MSPGTFQEAIGKAISGLDDRLPRQHSRFLRGQGRALTNLIRTFVAKSVSIKQSKRVFNITKLEYLSFPVDVNGDEVLDQQLWISALPKGAFQTAVQCTWSALLRATLPLPKLETFMDHFLLLH
ncbi:hypothetical protein EG68_01904 [Paragonimus skrjabini miyazakii]|uniref:Uncharacterized protein n=1 Tax=Paragonimus skrjabini miyazakii TaxID=59628 RepID=A0A8S9Z2C2_9TREM|nr:hypothetical protein EG68_01904 [Paragonimus skrjabini miyazakii]